MIIGKCVLVLLVNFKVEKPYFAKFSLSPFLLFLPNTLLLTAKAELDMI